MAETITIEKSPALEKSQDYAYLRQAGIAHLQALGSRIWTDYNIHDPGVMVLEMLAYAITDLGYRTDYDIQDLLSLKEDDGYFHTARNILTINPTTVNDYRKLLMDVEGVKNAWLTPSATNEIPIYLHNKEARLTYVKPNSKSEPLQLNGLYNVRLEFEEDDEYGDLNDPLLKRTVIIDGKTETIEFSFPTWEDLLKRDPKEQTLLRDFIDRGQIAAITVEDVAFDGNQKGYVFTLKIDFKYRVANPVQDPGFACGMDMPLEKFGDSHQAISLLPIQPILSEDTATGTISGLKVLARYSGRADIFEPEAKKLLEDNAEGRLLEFYRQKIRFTLDIVDRVWCKLLDHRNLCEDFLSIDSLTTEEIAICADIEIKADADVNKVMADIIHQVEDFISPPVNFYTIQQLLDQGLTTDQIFNGPALDHGFIKDDELDQAILKKEIHTSDIINIIMDVEGVLAVKSLQIANYINGDPQTDGTSWSLCLKGDGKHVPKLSEEKSKILFFKDILPYRANLPDVYQYLAELRVRSRNGRLKETDLDLEVPEGVDLSPGTYSTIQDNFPVAFGTTQYGIPNSPDEKRKAQAKQFKAYLLFFEQLLANYLAQLAHVKDLFSMRHDATEHTYFTQAITDPKDIEDLLVKYDSVDGFEHVEKALVGIAESKELYEDRKNRFLNHLAARFAESFGEYALLMYALRDEKAGAELIEDKLQFLADYPAISHDRGRAFNYRPTRGCKVCFPNALWNTRNVAGFKKRVARLLGMPHYHRRNLTGHMFALYENVYTQRPNTWVWKLHDLRDPAPVLKDKKVLLTSLEYESQAEANRMITVAIAMVEMGKLLLDDTAKEDRACCNRVGVDDLLGNPPAGTPVPGFILHNRCDDPIACSPAYSDQDQLRADYEFVRYYIMEFCNLENFHVIEHILLRPKFKGSKGKSPDTLLPICAEPTPETAENRLIGEFYQDVKGMYRFRIEAEEGYVALRSQASFKTLDGAQLDLSIMDVLRRDESNFKRRVTKDGRHYFALVDDTGEVRATSHAYKTQEEMERQIRLLTGGKICSEFSEPYSFRVSVVLPSWAGRFKDINYRRLVEKTMRMEAPAHVFLRICWIDRDQMADFECKYMNWLLAYGKCNSSPEQISPSMTALIEKLFSLENVYPLATLHNCDDTSGNDAQVVLNYTSIGTL